MWNIIIAFTALIAGSVAFFVCVYGDIELQKSVISILLIIFIALTGLYFTSIYSKLPNLWKFCCCIVISFGVVITLFATPKIIEKEVLEEFTISLEPPKNIPLTPY